MTTSLELCSLDWDDADVPVWGSAKSARVIVGVEVAGAWGRDPVKESGLTAPKGATLYVMRAVGRHARTPTHAHIVVSGGFGSDPWIVEGSLTPAQIATFLDGDVTDPQRWSAFGLEAREAPVLLVCTNGKRDACCAVRGRPVALAAHEAAPGGVWEVSHIGGHRFAPTAIHLPSGQTFGRLTEEHAAVLASADMTSAGPAELFRPTTHRGRVDLVPAAQVAETWWRERHPGLTMAPVTGIGELERIGDEHVVPLPDGARLHLRSVPGPTLRDSCVKAPKPSSHFVVESLEPAADEA